MSENRKGIRKSEEREGRGVLRENRRRKRGKEKGKKKRK